MDRRPAAWQAAALFALLAAILTWPQVRHPLSVPLHFDPYFSLWRVAWIAHQLPLDPAHLFDGNMFYPLRHTLAFSDAVLLEGMAAAPFIWFGVPVVLVYNVEVFASFVLCGLGMFLLVRELTGSAAAGLVSGAIFAFAPYRFDHYVHLELLWAQWMPLALWRLHRTLRTGALRDGLWTGGFFALQGLSCVYFTVFFATLLLVLVPLLLWLATPASMRRRAVTALAAGALLAIVVLVPYLLPYRAARAVVGERSGAADQAAYAAGPKHYLAALPSSLIYGGLTGSLGVHEKRLFPGALPLVLVAIALWPPIDRTRLAYAAALLVALDISFGARGLLLSPLQDHVAVFRGLRVMARMAGLVLMVVAVLAGAGAHRLLVMPRFARRGRALVAILLGVLAIEYAMWPMPLEAVATEPRPVYRWLHEQPVAPVAELPMPRHEPADLTRDESRHLYSSTFHWRPLVNGYSGFWPAEYILLVRAVSDFPSDTALGALRDRGVRFLIVHERLYGRETYRAVTRELASRQDVEPGPTFSDDGDEVRVFVMRP